MAAALSGSLAGTSALAGGVSVFGIGIGVGASGCCAYAGIEHVVAAISDNTARSVVAVQRIDLRFRFLICPIVNFSACTYPVNRTLPLRPKVSVSPLPSFARVPGRGRPGLRGPGRCLASKLTTLMINVSISQSVNYG